MAQEKPQDDGTQKVEQPEKTQVAEPTEEPEPGAEETRKEPEVEVKPERTYTQAEWSKRESEKDTEAGQLRKTLSQLGMQVQIAEAERGEATARAKDKSEIDSGLITEAEAEQRQQARLAQFQQAAQMRPKMEQMGRVMAAQDFGEKYSVNPYELLNDKSITTPDEMEAKAKEVSKVASDTASKAVSDELSDLKAKIRRLEEGEPQFDQGQTSLGGGALPTTAKGLIKSGWEDLDRKKK